ncbi:hypothetical protein [Microvirga sp. Mcv34]|uniref:hypothetical protein n=1 Tax=Microvirga sp. Mcv34 TaxID=2926016 RepID=UPI0021C7C58F|nr:hypothetical protein [Microvirga sp. Mcv34]
MLLELALRLTRRAESTPGPLPCGVDAVALGLLRQLRVGILNRCAVGYKAAEERQLSGHVVLWDLLTRAAGATVVTGASYSDYRTLQEEVGRNRPIVIAKLGIDLSTITLAQTLRDKEIEGEPKGNVIATEDDDWTQTALECLPEELRAYGDTLHSPKVARFYKCFRGVPDESVYDRPNGFVFSDQPGRAVADDHYLTFHVLQKVFGLRRGASATAHRPVTKRDVGHLPKENSLQNLLLLPTVLKLRMNSDE